MTTKDHSKEDLKNHSERTERNITQHAILPTKLLHLPRKMVGLLFKCPTNIYDLS